MNRIIRALRKWVNGTDLENPFYSEIGRILPEKEEPKPDPLKLINRDLGNGNMISQHLSIEPPKDLTLQWDASEYEMVSMTPGELILKRREEE